MYEKIKELCTSRGETINGLEIKLGFGRGSIAKWKKCNPIINRLKAVADYFRIPLEELIKDDPAGTKGGGGE